MAQIRHSKFKNTGILFELLTRQITADVLNGRDRSVSVDLIRRYFNSNSVLGKELALYKTLSEQTFSSKEKARDLIEAVVNRRQKLSVKELKNQKYNLIKEIKENYDIAEFFRNKLSNYKELASIYKMFEFSLSEDYNPTEEVNVKHTLIDHITRESTDNSAKSSKLDSESNDLKVLTYKIMVDRFNDKYSGELDKNQKMLLREYINNVSSPDKFREYVDSQADFVESKLKLLSNNVKDDVLQIKINEVISHTNQLKRGSVVSDKQVLQLMRYYELLKELNQLND